MSHVNVLQMGNFKQDLKRLTLGVKWDRIQVLREKPDGGGMGG